MKIVECRATPVVIGLTCPAATAMGSGSAVTRTIVELVTDEGIVGLGETDGAYAATLIGTRFASRIRGFCPLERETVRSRCLPAFNDYGTSHQPMDVAAYSAIEMALWDILGKTLGMPLYRILGGAVRERACFVAYAFTLDLAAGHRLADVPDEMARIAREQVSRTGAGMFEFKVGRHPVDCDIATLKAVRAALGPDILIGVDANMRYDIDDARRFLAAALDQGLSNIEEPCASLSDCARLRRDFGIPVSTHCTDVDAIRMHPEIDGVVGAVDAQGGIARTLELAAVFNAIGRRYWLRSCVETGIGWAAMVHLGMACRAMDRPSQALIQWIEDDLIEGEPWLMKDGGVRPPDIPGLGIVLDRASLDRHAERFRREGERTYFDEP